MSDNTPERGRPPETVEDPADAHARILLELVAGKQEKNRALAERLGFRAANNEEDTPND